MDSTRAMYMSSRLRKKVRELMMGDFAGGL